MPRGIRVLRKTYIINRKPFIYNIFINVTYAAIFFTVLVQGLSVGRVYRRLEAHKLARQMRAKK